MFQQTKELANENVELKTFTQVELLRHAQTITEMNAYLNTYELSFNLLSVRNNKLDDVKHKK